jgi:hypothetical protein
MPAIQPARLKHQTARLAAVFEQPEDFLKALINLLNFYADHTHRAGQIVVPTSTEACRYLDRLRNIFKLK